MAIIRGYDPSQNKIKMLLLGPPKTGKTLFAATFPKPIVFDFEGGWAAHSAKYPDVHYGVYMDVNLSAPKAFADFNKDFTDVLKSDEYETIVLDTLGSMQTIIMNRSLSQQRKRGIGLGDGIVQPTMEDWNYVATMTRNVVERACASNKHVIVTSHEITRTRYIQDESGGREVPDRILVDFSGDGKEREYFQKRFDIFGRMEPEIKARGKDKVEFTPRVRMRAVGNLLNLGSRWDCFDVYEEPAYENLMSKITSYHEGLVDKNQPQAQ